MASTLFKQILHPDSRAHPWDLYAELRKEAVSVQDDGTYVVSRYEDVKALLSDPRISSDVGKATPGTRMTVNVPTPGTAPTFIIRDNPEHDRLRGLTMRHFGPPARPGGVEDYRPMVERLVRERLDNLMGRAEFDLVEEFSHPIPVRVICHMMGIPLEEGATILSPLLGDVEREFMIDPTDAELVEIRSRHQEQAIAYLSTHVERLRENPGDDMLSRMIHDEGPGAPLNLRELLGTALMVFGAGHETTVNLITSSMLLLLRHPDQLARLKADPSLAYGAVEESLRMEPPAHMRPRAATADIRIGDQTIPKGASVILNLASANRDPRRFTDPDTFDITRPDNAHLSFAGGTHFCFGAPLGRMEGQIAVRELSRRLVGPRLLQDPPPYRDSPDLRGPSELRLGVDEVLPA
ncbi:cytochrome P450 [Streptomyces capitiformicae]|uniref:Cytochrome P450 n=1 Tax=Streptomyces capitiformicae TaxID=2014920 RepID=A0A918Z8W6_9ACTN|nr:cytochrome P450 [Streptomyces capitiformicae]GHE41796.1 putative cytochrome P450 [Streptomyces capitiformicae]